MSLIWILYVALEPFVRRRWPHVLVSWTRLLAGEWRDPLLGRDALIGCAAGVGFSMFDRLLLHAPAWLGFTEAVQPLFSRFEILGSRGQMLGALLDTIGSNFASASGFLFLLFFLRVVLRNQLLAAAVFAGTFGLLSAATQLYNVPWFFKLGPFVIWALVVFVLARFGLVAFVVAQLVSGLLNNFPMTLDSSLWYAGVGYLALGVIVGIALYGARASLGGRRLFELADT
jgi:serine/threonine-protein kinase